MLGRYKGLYPQSTVISGLHEGAGFGLAWQEYITCQTSLVADVYACHANLRSCQTPQFGTLPEVFQGACMTQSKGSPPGSVVLKSKTLQRSTLFVA